MALLQTGQLSRGRPLGGVGELGQFLYICYVSTLVFSELGGPDFCERLANLIRGFEALNYRSEYLASFA